MFSSIPFDTVIFANEKCKLIERISGKYEKKDCLAKLYIYKLNGLEIPNKFC